MTVAFLIAGFTAGVSMLGWYYSDERVRKLRRENRQLRADLDHALGAMKPKREFTKLHLLSGSQDREAHSHAEKGSV